MKFRHDAASIGLYWFGRALDFRASSAAMHDFLRALQVRAGVMRDLYVMDRRGYIPFDGNGQDLEKEIAQSIDNDRFFYDKDGRKCEFSPLCFSLDGFVGAFTDSKRDSDRTVTLSVLCGQVLSSASPTYTPNVVLLHVRPDIATPDMLRQLLLASLDFWRPADAKVDHRAVDLPDHQPDEILPGYWMYIANPAVSDAVSSDFAREYYADGVILKAVEEPDLSANPDHLARVTRLRDELRAAGWLTRRRELSARFPSITIPIAA